MVLVLVLKEITGISKVMRNFKCNAQFKLGQDDRKVKMFRSQADIQNFDQGCP